MLACVLVVHLGDQLSGALDPRESSSRCDADAEIGACGGGQDLNEDDVRLCYFSAYLLGELTSPSMTTGLPSEW